MPRYPLRTLLILLAIVPPLVAGLLFMLRFAFAETIAIALLMFIAYFVIRGVLLGTMTRDW
jgi:hypothetical protein